ncbi:O-antigen polymerase [Kocuria sp. LHG3120]|uniref:O-antigen polymerase n=1 Tax=Kocuria sp. LHG3120 TaxID=2804590 RepID=UPI003CF32ED0
MWIISALVLCIVIPLLLHNATGGPSNQRNPWWATAIIVTSGLAYSAVIASRGRQLFGMVLWLFTYIFMGMAPYVQFRLDVLPGTTPEVDQDLYPAAGALVIVASLAVMAGAILARRRPAGTSMRQLRVDPTRANILTLFALAVFAYYGSTIGFGSFLLSRSELSAIRESAWGASPLRVILTGGQNMLLLVGFIAQMTVRQQAKLAGRKPQWLLPLINGVVLIYAVNPVSSARYVVGTVILAMLATFGAYATLQRFRMMAVASVAGMLFIFPLADLFRRSTDVSVQVEGPIRALTSGDFDAFAQLTNTLSYVGSNGLSWGGQILGALLFWVPRSIWPSKPQDTGVVLAEAMGYRFTNLSSPIWSELFIDFGWVGVILGMGVLGYLFMRWDVRTDLYLATSRVPPVVVSATAFYLLIVLRGSLLNAVSYLLVILLAAWFVTPRVGKASRTTAGIKRPQHSPRLPLQTAGTRTHQSR